LQQLPDFLAATSVTLSPLHALRITMDILEGLAYVHHKKLMHRDLKSDNVAIVLPSGVMQASAALTLAANEAAVFNSSLSHDSVDDAPLHGIHDNQIASLASLPASSLSSLSSSPLPRSLHSPSEASVPSACIIDFGMARAFDTLDNDNDLATHFMDPENVAAALESDDSDDDASFPVRAVSAHASIPLYCAPEIPFSHGLYDCKADMWAGMWTRGLNPFQRTSFVI
jgi:serine/threonine protein kinase